jgi:hypothetical protein
MSICKIIFSFIILIVLICPLFIFASVTDFGFENTVLKSNKKDVKIYQKNDGTIIKSYKKYDIAEFKDGTVIKKYRNGIREVKYKDGRKLVVNEKKGTRTYYSIEGKKQVFSFNSRTPYGAIIVEKKQTIQKNPVSVVQVYNAIKSDEILDGEMKNIFNDIYKQLKRNVTKKKYSGKNPLEISVSFCRFCTTGYCYKKPKEITIDYIVNGKIRKKLKVKYLLLKDKKKRRQFLEKAGSLLYKVI